MNAARKQNGKVSMATQKSKKPIAEYGKRDVTARDFWIGILGISLVITGAIFQLGRTLGSLEKDNENIKGNMTRIESSVNQTNQLLIQLNSRLTH